MKKYLSFAAFALLTMAMTFSLSACGDDDDDVNAAGSASNPQSPADPEGTITMNMRYNDGYNILYLPGFYSYYYENLFINSANNFKCISCEISCVGKVNGLAAVKSVPQSGWTNETSVVPGYGYVIRGSSSTGQYDKGIYDVYARLYVVDYLESGNLGAIIKYQSPWVP